MPSFSFLSGLVFAEETLKKFRMREAISSCTLGHMNAHAFYSFPLLHIVCKGLNFKTQTSQKRDFPLDRNISVPYCSCIFTWFQIAEPLSSCVHRDFFTNEAVLQLGPLLRSIFAFHKAPCLAKQLIIVIEDSEFVCLLTGSVLKDAPARGGEELGGNSHNQAAATSLSIGSRIKIN